MDIKKIILDELGKLELPKKKHIKVTPGWNFKPKPYLIGLEMADAEDELCNISGYTLLDAWYRPDLERIDIQHINVEKSLRKQGIARQLIEATKDIARQTGLPAVRAIYVTDEKAGFWKHMGFEYRNSSIQQHCWEIQV